MLMLHLLTWIATGILAGFGMRVLLRAPLEWGWAGDLLMGCFGGVLGGWLFRRTGFIGSADLTTHVLFALVGAITLLSLMRTLRRLLIAAATAAVASPIVVGLEERIRGLGETERRVVTAVLTRQRLATDPNQSFEQRSTFGERLADQVARFGGSWTFIGLFGIVMVGWISLNEEMTTAFDPFPFILLNLILSCLAALQAPVIMMSQNRQAARDRSDAKSDYEVNVRAEMEIMALHSKMDLLREHEWSRLVMVIERQQQTLEQLQRRLDTIERPDR